MARIAACLMLSGVGKSGSPALKSTTSTPVRRSLSASAITFIVDDSLIEDMRSAMVAVGAFRVGVMSCQLLNSALLILQTLAETLLYRWRNKPRNIPAQADNLFHQFRADERELLSGQQEYSLQLRLQAPVHQRHLQFIFVIRDRPDAAQNHARAPVQCVVGEQSVEAIHFNVLEPARDFGQHLHPLFYAEQWRFGFVSQNRNNEPSKKP